jgi:hypothetical protein
MKRTGKTADYPVGHGLIGARQDWASSTAWIICASTVCLPVLVTGK